MQVKTKAIVLSSLKYGDTSLIVRAYTYTDGLKSYLLKGVLSARKGKLRAAYFQPLTQLELVANHKNKGTLENIRDLQLTYTYKSLYSDIAKNAMAIFLAEVLVNCLKEEEGNPALFQFLETTLQWLDTHDQIANFHISFLLELTKYLGFYPDISHSSAAYFDLEEGEFVNHRPLGPSIEGRTRDNFVSFLGINFDASQSVKLGKDSRQDLLQALVLYFEVHLQGFKKPKSLAVLNEVFH